MLFALGLAALGACTNPAAQDASGYSIDATITGADSVLVRQIALVDGEYEVIDSTYSDHDGHFTFSGDREEAQLYYIGVGGGRNIIDLFIGGDQVSITGSMDSLDALVVSGSETYDTFKSFTDDMSSFDKDNRELYMRYMQAQQEGDSAQMSAIDDEYDALMERQDAYRQEFIANNASSPVAPYLIFSNLYGKEASELQEELAVVDTSLSESLYYTMLTEQIALLEKVAVGMPAVVFTQNDTSGQAIALDQFKGQYLLIDFWASWCGPCRQENPNVVAMYEEYHKKGFEILGVSFDTDRDKWLGAIDQDGLMWPQVSDLAGWDNAAGKLYGVRSIPHTVLLDPEGNIIAKNLRGEELREKLDELFAEA